MRPTYDEALVALSSRLSERALSHSVRVADEAASLADTYGVDVDAARLAGLLHDWHRETPAAVLIERAREMGLMVTDVDLAVPYLLHGPVAAVDLADEFPGLGDDVRSAVAAHTYGASVMSDLAMVVYIADVIEPKRHHATVGDIREAVGTVTLRELFVRAYAASFRHLIDARLHVHPSTVATWNAALTMDES